MFPNHNVSAEVAVVGVIDPDAYGTGAQSTGWIDMQNWFRLLGIVMAGDLGSSATLDAKFEQATSAGGANAKDVSGSSITQLTQAGTDSNKQALINLRQDDLDRNNGFRWVRLTMTVGTATSDAGGLVVGMDPRYHAANASDAASVDEIVS